MAIFRVEKSKDYTVMSNHHLRSTKLSLKAKGLLSQMLSLPEDWDYTLAGLAAINKEGVDSIRSAVQELEIVGYIQRRQTQDSGGKFSGNEYVIYETPVTVSPLLENPTTVENDNLPLLDYPITAKPSTDNPLSEKPLSENPTQLNIDILSKDKQSKDESKKKNKKEKQAPKTAPDWKPERFAGFWEFYRTHCRGEKKQAAIKAWDKLQPDDALIAHMGESLKKQIRSPDWQRGIGIPHASTWLNGRRWEDEPKIQEFCQLEPIWKPERFAAFWDFYRTHCRGENKQDAIFAWDKLQPDDALIAHMGESLKKQIRSPDWQRGIGIPHASTWLNSRRWEDEPKIPDTGQNPETQKREYF